ncbi:MAG: radical SAM family heme chaperone HemW [Acidobacteria bacterium]|nr:MAG: radical SAM family heme chaperone HemW [Acidobacteriota bacterium]
METLGLYIQIPFCASKCSFCNFSSRVARSNVYDNYCRALAREIESLPKIYQTAGMGSNIFETPVGSIYMGGGTPSLLGSYRIERIIAELRRPFRFASNAEFTLEVTPGSADKEFLERALKLGINRLSIGAQSFDNGELWPVGRLHSADDTRALIQAAHTEGFANISVDLIAGLPHQTETSWDASLHSAIALEPAHISIYLFEIDEKSRLGSEVLRHGGRYHADAIPDEDFVADAYDRAREVLHQAGYLQYEISNFAFPGRESVHNRKYWQLKPYLGLGAGAHSSDGQFRWENATSVEEYERRLARGDSPVCEQRRLTADTQLEEFFFLGLRQLDGISLDEAEKRWGSEPIERWTQKIESLANDGWIERCNGRLRLAKRALLVSNEIFQEFIDTSPV